MTAERSLPSGWRWVRFGDVVRQVTQTTKDPKSDGLTRIVGLDHLDSESLPLRRWDELADLPDGTSFTRVFRAGHVLFGKRRAYQRKVAVADFDGVCSGDILVFEPSTDELLPEFLPYLVQSDEFFEHALGTSAGSLSPRTKWQELAKYELALPHKRDQERTTAIMQPADQVSSLLDEASRHVGLLAESLFEEAAVSATYKVLDDVLLESPRNGLTIAPSPDDTGVWSLTVGSASPSGYAAEGKKWIQPPKDSARFLVEPGDLFVTRSNTLERVGLPLVVPASEPESLYYSDLLMRLRPDPEQIPTSLLEQYLRTTRTRTFIQSIAAGTSASMKKINGRNLKRLPIPIIPEAERTALVLALDRVRALEEARLAHLRESMSLRRDLLRELLHV